MSMRSKTCLCCGSSQILRHVGANGIYWMCMSCRQEVPLLNITAHPSRDSIAETSGIRSSLEA